MTMSEVSKPGSGGVVTGVKRAVWFDIFFLSVVLFGLGFLPVYGQTGKETDEAPFNAGFRIVDVPVRDRTVTTAIWYPTQEEVEEYHYGSEESTNRGSVAMKGTLAANRERYPFLFYSHGFGGSGIGYTYLTESLARHGWIVVAPDHRDPLNLIRIRSGWRGGRVLKLINQLQERINKMSGSSDDRYQYRPEDVRGVMDHVLQMDRFGDRIDRDRLAIGGHSFGGFTALSVCGASGEPYDPEFQAILLHSPAAWMYGKEQLQRIEQPVLYMLGEEEAQRKRGNITLRQRGTNVLSYLPGPGYYMEIGGASHFSFNTAQRDGQMMSYFSGSQEEFSTIRHYSRAFLSYYVLDNQKDRETLLNELPGRSLFQMNPEAKEN